MDAERWQRLSPLLDALFELEPEERARSLELMREEDPHLASELEALIELEQEREDFLSEPLVAPLPGPRPGGEVGPYRLERMLGEGGMGQVWLAARADGLYQRRVALKLLRPGLADPNLRLRFTRERQILARLAHPHIARLLDAGVSIDHQPYLALEYIEGEPITDYCRNRKVGLEARLRLFEQVCAAVSHAHANLIVHRDLKPSNILVTPAGEVRLLDFGIAKLLDTEPAAPEPHTRTGLRAFTLHYAAPEQIRGEPVTTMTDVYSLGVVLFELLTDAKPYQLKRQSDAEWEEAILLADPQKPSLALQRAADADFEGQLAPGLRRRARALAGDLDNIVLKALAKPPEQRYPSVEALALDLQRYQVGKPVQARPQSVGYRLHKFVSRHRWALATGSLAVAVLSAALAIVAWQARQAVQEAARAQAMQDFVTGLFEGAGTARRGEPMDLRALLDAGIVRASRELARQPRARAEVFGVVARLRLGLGDDRAALSLLQRQDLILDSLDRVPASLRLESITLQGRSQRQLGEERGCIATMSPWLATARREQAQIPARVADFYSQLARCHRANGERNLARQLFERSLMLRRDLLDDDLGVVENQVDLASLHADAGDHDAAMRGLRAAMARLHDQFGDRHPLAIEIHRQTGALQFAIGDIDAAESALREAAALAVELQGKEHPAALELQRRLAELHMEQGRFDEAERELRAAHPVLVAQLGAQHVDVGSNDHSLGVVAWERGDLAEARRALARAVANWRGPDGAALLPGGLIDYAAVLHASGRHDEAQRALVEARRLWVERFGERHPLLADVDRLLGEVLASKGLQATALAHFEQARRYTYDAYGPDNARSRRAELALARALARQGDPRALVRIDAIAALPEGDHDTRRLRWRARAYAADVRCRNGLRTQGYAELSALDAELRSAMPGGGVIPREVAALLAGCAPGTG